MSVLDVKLDGCIVWNAHNTVLGLKRSAICVQAGYFLSSCIRQGLVSCDSVVDLMVIAACDWVMSALSPCCQPPLDVAENMGRFLVRSLQSSGITLNWFQR